VRGLFVVEAQPPLVVKGHAEPLRTWLVRGIERGPEPMVTRGIDGVATSMVGRDAELARLTALYARCVADRDVGVATVVADAGVGKTRLRQELLRTLGLAEGDAGLLQARANPSSGLQPYGLLRQLLARWLSIRDDLIAAEARLRLVEGLAPWLGADAAHQAARIGQLIGLDFGQHPAVQAMDAPALRNAAFEALRAALYARAAHTPLLLVLDDLHWADEGSLAFVQSLLQPADRPLMLVLLARPSLHERGIALDPSPGVPVEALRLEPLGPESGLVLVQALLRLLPDAPDSLQRLLLERSGGNPFFLEALVRMLIDDGVIVAGARPWRLNQDRLAALRVPPTLVGVLQARLDALPATDLRALQQASIIGPVFWDAALAAIDSEAPLALPALGQRTLVARREHSAFASTLEHAFAHALLHDVTYATVLKGQRREGHAAVAHWLSDRVSDRAGEFLAITAEHHERAGDSAKALEYWDRAYTDARGRYANDAALQFIERALAQPALTDLRWRFLLLHGRHEVLERMGRSADAAQARERMAAWAEDCDDNAMRATLLTARMLAADHEGRPDEARLLAGQALVQAAQAGAAGSSAAALAHGELAWLATLRHDYATVAAEVEAGMAHARVAAQLNRRQMGSASYLHQLRAIEVEGLLKQQRYVDALAAVDQALAEILSTVQDHYSLLSRKAWAERELGRLDEALATAERSLAIAQATGMPRLRVHAQLEMAQVALWRGDLDRADACLVETAAEAAVPNNSLDRVDESETRGELALARGETDDARQAWQNAQKLSNAIGLAHGTWRVRCQLARLDLSDGRTAAAHAIVNTVLAEAADDPRLHRRALPPAALLTCHEVLKAAGDPRADALRDDLLARLDEQLAALPDDAAREQLLRRVPHWKAAQALR
ncbi:MAG: AAA family ATPase, partial [Betaproteobacteria bacterium]